MQAQSADGVIHDFPDGTDMSVVDRVMKSYAADALVKNEPNPAFSSDTIPTESAPVQSLGGAAVQAAGQGLVSGVGSIVSGAGDIAKAGLVPWWKQVQNAMDLVDAGKSRDAYQNLTDAQRQQVGAYRGASPASKAAQRAALQQAIDDYDKPNLAQQMGSAIEQVAPEVFPVEPENEGHITGAMRMVGGVGPLIGAGALGGPAGLLASTAAIGAQAFHGARKDAIANGASDEEADTAAGKSALGQMAAMSIPIGRALQIIPVPLREGFLKTVASAGRSGVELSAGNTLGTMAQNYVAQQTYDPTRPVFKSTGDAAIDGFLAGLVVHGAGAVAGAGRPAATIADIGQAPNVDAAIAAAGEAAQASVPAEATPQSAIGWGDLFGPAANDVTAPVPQSAGAAASRDMSNPNVADISTADMKANRRVAEMDELLRPPAANDTMIYVPGSFPTLAEMSADPVTSQTENLVRQRNPGEFIGEGKRLTENNKARINAYDDLTVPDTTLNTMRRDREARWVAATEDILPNAKAADLTPALDWVQEQLSNPRIQENDAVRSVLENFHDRLVDDGGRLKTDPAAVWGIHDNLQNQLAKAKDPLNMTGAEKFAESQILAAKGLIDDAMNVATDNRFQTALNNYAEDSKAINSGVLLNDFRPKLTNMSGELQAAAFHRFVVNLAKERGDPGIDPSMDISDATMRTLINIDTDLKRAGLIKLGSAAGSPTNLLSALAEKAGIDTAHSVLGAVPVAGPLLKAATGLLSQHRLNVLTQKHLAEPEGGYTYPEPDEPGTPPSAGPLGGGSGGQSGPSRPPPAEPAPVPPSPVMVSVPAGRPAAGGGPGESVAFTPSGAPVPVRYTVRDASDLIASQLADGRTNPAFPAALQPRDRTRAASIQQVNSIANRLQPERLGASASTSEGAPIVGPDGVVESGNGRTMAIMQAYADGGPLADAYRQWVAAQGYDTSGMRNPVLVRERLGDLDIPARARLAADMGASPIAAMSAPERAAADARAIPADILAMYQGGDVTLAKNAPFVRAFADHVIPPGEQAAFMTADGGMSADGAVRLRNALTQHAYGSNSLVTSLAENADPDIRAFGGALMDAAGDMAKLRGAIDSGAVSKGSDIAPDIVAAAQLIQTARRQRISLSDAVGQRDAFSELPEKTEDILQAAFGDNYAGRMSRARMADLLATYAQEAQMQSGLFGANLTAGEMLAGARAKYGYGTKAGSKGGPSLPIGNGPGLDFNRPEAR